jgi:hypothetical protein
MHQGQAHMHTSEIEVYVLHAWLVNDHMDIV